MEKIQSELKQSVYGGKEQGRLICGIRMSKGCFGLGQSNLFMLMLDGAACGNIVSSIYEIINADIMNSKGYTSDYGSDKTRVRLGSNAGRSGLYL